MSTLTVVYEGNLLSRNKKRSWEHPVYAFAQPPLTEIIMRNAYHRPIHSILRDCRSSSDRITTEKLSRYAYVQLFNWTSRLDTSNRASFFFDRFDFFFLEMRRILYNAEGELGLVRYASSIILLDGTPWEIPNGDFHSSATRNNLPSPTFVELSIGQNMLVHIITLAWQNRNWR